MNFVITVVAFVVGMGNWFLGRRYAGMRRMWPAIGRTLVGVVYFSIGAMVLSADLRGALVAVLIAIAWDGAAWVLAFVLERRYPATSNIFSMAEEDERDEQYKDIEDQNEGGIDVPDDADDATGGMIPDDRDDSDD